MAYDERPILPPIQSLHLPVPASYRPTLPSIHEYFNSRNDRMPLNISHHYQNRRTTTLTTPSPTLSALTTSPTFISRAHSPIPRISTPQTWRLIPSPLETADAVVLYPPPDQPSILVLRSPKRDRALFLVGDALKQLRRRQRPIAKGAIIHPFKMVRKLGGRRRSSVSSTLSS